MKLSSKRALGRARVALDVYLDELSFEGTDWNPPTREHYEEYRDDVASVRDYLKEREEE